VGTKETQRSRYHLPSREAKTSGSFAIVAIDQYDLLGRSLRRFRPFSKTGLVDVTLAETWSISVTSSSPTRHDKSFDVAPGGFSSIQERFLNHDIESYLHTQNHVKKGENKIDS
jgi:hypothetical protein